MHNKSYVLAGDLGSGEAIWLKGNHGISYETLQLKLLLAHKIKIKETQIEYLLPSLPNQTHCSNPGVGLRLAHPSSKTNLFSCCFSDSITDADIAITIAQ